MVTLGAVLLLAGLLLGLTLLRFLPLRFRRPEYLAAACVVGLLAAAWATLLGAWGLGYRWGLPCAVLALAAAAALGWSARRQWQAVVSTRWFLAPRDMWIWLATSLAVGALLGTRFVVQMLWTKDGAYFSSSNTWGDLALHLSLLTRFAYQDHFTWDFPIFYGGKLSYPFLIDFLGGVLHRLGWTLQWALIVPGFALAFSFVQLLYFTVYRWFRSSAAAAIATVLFLANGAPAGIVYFWREWRASGKPLFDFLAHLEKMYAHLPDQGLHISNIVTDYLLPQRSILFGLPLFLLISVLLRQAWVRPARSGRLLAASAILTGLLPFAHVHAFFVVIGMWGWLVAVQSVRRRSLWNPWTGAWVLACVLAAPQVVWQFAGSYSNRFSHWQLWWLKPLDENPVVFWFRNLGLALPLGLLVLVWLWRTRASRGFYLHYYFAILVLFALTNVYLFQPNVWDNMKFMVFCYLVLAIFMGAILARWASWSWWSAGAVALIVISLSTAGALSIVRESQISWMLSTPEEITAAKTFRKIIPTEARVLTSDQHSHFVPVLAGRRIMMGYRGSGPFVVYWVGPNSHD